MVRRETVAELTQLPRSDQQVLHTIKFQILFQVCSKNIIIIVNNWCVFLRFEYAQKSI